MLSTVSIREGKEARKGSHSRLLGQSLGTLRPMTQFSTRLDSFVGKYVEDGYRYIYIGIDYQIFNPMKSKQRCIFGQSGALVRVCVCNEHTMSIATIYWEYTNIERTALLKTSDSHLVNATIKTVDYK